MSVLKIKDNNEWASIPSIKGDTGDAAGFGTATATVDTGVGTPSCDVTLSGDDTAKNFAFAFHNLMYDDSDLQSDFADLEGDFNTLQAQFDTAIAAVSVDDELHDIRVGDDGVTYASAGAAVRGQFHDVKSDIDAIELEVNPSIHFKWEHGGIDNATGATNNDGSLVRSRDVTYYSTDNLVYITNGSSSVLWIIFYTKSGGTYTFASSISVSAGDTYAFQAGKYVRFDIRGSLEQASLVSGKERNTKIVSDTLNSRGEIEDIKNGTNRTFAVTYPSPASASSSGEIWFDVCLIENEAYVFTNNTNAGCTLRLMKYDGTEKIVSSSVSAGASLSFVADDKYKQIGGWFNGTGTISIVGGVGINALPNIFSNISELQYESKLLSEFDYTLSSFSMLKILDIECAENISGGDAPSEDYTVSANGDYISVSGQSTSTKYILLKADMPKLTAGTYYIIVPSGTMGASNYGVNFLDKNKNTLISSIYVNNDSFGTLTLSSDVEGIEYVSIALTSANHEYNLNGYVWIANSSVPYRLLNQQGYQPKYRSRIQFNLLKGKKFVSFGDSQTEQNKWQPFVADALGMTSLVKGYGGYPITPCDPNNTGFALSSDYILGQLETYLTANDFDIVLVMGGTNDWAYDGVRNPEQSNVLIGNDTDVTNATFKGALKKIVKTILTNHPTKQVILMSPIGGQTRETGVNLTEPMTNANGYTLGTFAKATADIAEYLGVPFIDVHECGITVFNSSTYLADGLHINANTGAAKVANAVINGLVAHQDTWIVQ